MPSLRIRWSESEARKAYARPFMVTFVTDDGADVGSVAVSGADLLYYSQFQAAVLALTGELFTDFAVEGAADPQGAWLDALAALLPALGEITVAPASSFDEHHGRVFRFTVSGGDSTASVDAAVLLEYQELQAVLAHQTGRIYRDGEIEAVADAGARRTAWNATLTRLVSRPAAGEAMSEAWPWR
jgi:hypothetical protein